MVRLSFNCLNNLFYLENLCSFLFFRPMGEVRLFLIFSVFFCLIVFFEFLLLLFLIIIIVIIVISFIYLINLRALLISTYVFRKLLEPLISILLDFECLFCFLHLHEFF